MRLFPNIRRARPRLTYTPGFSVSPIALPRRYSPVPMEMGEPPNFNFDLPDFPPGGSGPGEGGIGEGIGDTGSGTVGAGPGGPSELPSDTLEDQYRQSEERPVFDVGTGTWVAETPQQSPIEVPTLEDMLETPDVSNRQTPQTPVYDVGTGEWVSEVEAERRRSQVPVGIPIDEEDPGVEPPRAEIPLEEIAFEEELEGGGGVLQPPQFPIPIEGGNNGPGALDEAMGPLTPADRRAQLEAELADARASGDLERVSQVLEQIEAEFTLPTDSVGGGGSSGGGGGTPDDTIIGINPGEQEHVPQTPEDVAENPRLETNFPVDLDRNVGFQRGWDRAVEAVNAMPEQETMGGDPSAPIVDFLEQPGALEWAVENGLATVEHEGGASGLFEEILAGGRDVLKGALLTGVLTVGIPAIAGGALLPGVPSSTPITDSILGGRAGFGGSRYL